MTIQRSNRSTTSGTKVGKDPVTKLMPGFRPGDEATTEQVLVEHLVCACTGLPRQDVEWFL